MLLELFCLPSSIHCYYRLITAQNLPKPILFNVSFRLGWYLVFCIFSDIEYLKVWNIDYTSHINKTSYSHLRNIDKEKDIESQITNLLRKTFYFRLIPLEVQEKRMGKTGIESRLIGTVANCKKCGPSRYWLGRYSPVLKISSGKLCLSQHLDSIGLTDSDKTYLLELKDEVLRSSIRKLFPLQEAI